MRRVTDSITSRAEYCFRAMPSASSHALRCHRSSAIAPSLGWVPDRIRTPLYTSSGAPHAGAPSRADERGEDQTERAVDADGARESDPLDERSGGHQAERQTVHGEGPHAHHARAEPVARRVEEARRHRDHADALHEAGQDEHGEG